MPTTGTGLESRHAAVFERVAKLLEQLCVFPIGDVEALAEIEGACTEAEAIVDPAERKKVIREAISQSQTASFIRRFSRLNDRLMRLGRWISPTYLAHGEITELEAMSDRLIALQNAGDDADADVLCEDIVQKVAMAAFDPHIRAFMNVRATRLPHLADVAHYLETATLQFYCQGYFSVANILIPAIERLLVSLTGWRLAHGGELHTSDFRAYLLGATTSSTAPTMKLRFEAHRDEIVRFLFDRFFKRAAVAEADGTYNASFVNRAFPLHLNEPGSYYTFEDCVTYFQVFDLFTEFVAAKYEQQLPGLIPDDDPEVQKRVSEYWGVILSDWLTGGNSPERRLVQPTPYYIRESDHNYLAIHDGVALNQLLLRALPSLDVKMLFSSKVPADRREKMDWLIRHLSGT